jgi:hypothetical protein
MPPAKKTAAKLPAKKKALPRVPKPQPQLGGAERFTILLEESEKFCEGVGLHKNLVREIIKTDSDWAFIRMRAANTMVDGPGQAGIGYFAALTA